MSPARRKPTFRITALVTLLTNVVVVVATCFLLAMDWGYPFGVLAFGIYFGMFFSALGVLFALVSLVRRERGWFVSLIALALNCVALMWIWSFTNRVDPWP